MSKYGALCSFMRQLSERLNGFGVHFASRKVWKCNYKQNSLGGDLNVRLILQKENLCKEIVGENKDEDKDSKIDLLKSSGASAVTNISEVDLKMLVDESQNWSLHIQRCLLEDWRLSIYFQRNHAFCACLQQVLSSGLQYGKGTQKCKTVILLSEEGSSEKTSDLSSLRIHLLKDLLKNLVRMAGYEVVESAMCDEDTIKLYLTTSSCGSIPEHHQAVVCGVVSNAKHRSKECSVSADDYYRLRHNDMRLCTEHKYGTQVKGEGWEKFLMCLTDSVVKMDLLSIKPKSTVSLNLDKESTLHRQSSSRGAFVLYNCARLARIRENFQQRVKDSYYPPLIPLSEVDFSLLSKEEEWDLLLNFILPFPSIIQSAVEDVEHGKLQPHVISNFLSAFSSSISGYYSRIHILTEPHPHLLPIMYARLYLLQGVEQVLHNALNLYDITPLVQM